MSGARGFSLVEDHNVVTVISDMGVFNGNLDIQVPVNTSVELKTINGGHIDVTGISGEHQRPEHERLNHPEERFRLRLWLIL